MKKFVSQNAQILADVKTALEITLKKVNEAFNDTQRENYSFFDECQNRKFAAAKRSALDLKNELTKLTQSSKYKRTMGNF